MQSARHTKEELDAIRPFKVPTLANAIETFGVIPSNSGYCNFTMKCHFPDLPLMLGYAVTARVSTDQPPSKVRPGIQEPDYWRFIASQPGPKVAVVQDIDNPPAGAMWGEWNANVHKALGCVGMVTEGAARDLEGVRKLNFHYFSTHILPTHGYGAFIDYGGSVRVAGLVVQTGDLLAGDQHGVILIPAEIPLLKLAEVAAEIDRLEGEIFAWCQSPDFSIEKLIELDASVASRWPKLKGEEDKMPYGYNGKILHVDLTSSTLTVEKPSESFYRKYLGGQGIGMYYILKEMPVGADPLGPENVLAITLGVVTGAPVSGQSRVMANAKSPLTGAIGDSQAGGFWPAEAKAAGFDAFIIRGKAEKPVYLWVYDGEAELRDATHLWGQVTGDAQAAIREELGDSKIQVMQVGPAGERLVRYACIINMCNRANGRTGMGAVMGSKNLKAIAVRGKNRPAIADQKALSEIAHWGAEKFPESDIYGMGLHGTAGDVPYMQAVGGLPTHNWASGSFDGYEAISGETMSDTILKERDTCYGCVVRCKRVVVITEWPYQVDPLYGGPEYETIATFGSYCGVSDLAAIAMANQLCNMYGLDTMSTGATIAWAMDCFQHGIITAEDTGGVELRWGNAEAMVKMTEMIAKRQGFGNLLAEGMVQAAKKLGLKAEALVTAVKGNALPAHMPQVKRSLALIYAVNPYGADHMSSEHDPSYNDYPDRMAQLGLLDPQPDKVLNVKNVRFTVYSQRLYSMLNTIGVCMFVWGPSWQLYGLSQLVDMVRAVTGWNVSLWELMKAGERSLNMMRAFNTREGFTSAEDKLPPKLFQPLTGGPSEGISVDKEEMIAAVPTYYAMCGWDAEGRPTRAKLEELGIAWVADELGL